MISETGPAGDTFACGDMDAGDIDIIRLPAHDDTCFEVLENLLKP